MATPTATDRWPETIAHNVAAVLRARPVSVNSLGLMAYALDVQPHELLSETFAPEQSSGCSLPLSAFTPWP